MVYLQQEREKCREHQIRVNVIGRRDRFSPELRKTIEETEKATSAGRNLLLRLAVDYSSRDAILRAAYFNNKKPLTRDLFSCMIGNAIHAVGPAQDVDLLIRTGGEKRLSDFLLWECAYAELFFTETMWPDFNEPELRTALDVFQQRTRRYGALQAV